MKTEDRSTKVTPVVDQSMRSNPRQPFRSFLDSLRGHEIAYAISPSQMADGKRNVYKELLALRDLFSCSSNPGDSLTPWYLLPWENTNLKELEAFMSSTNIPFTKIHRTAVR